ncbi:L,D-transpeptidase [Streptomyces armeniacus]|nr:L,D-transpeptidase [Streptomyces armeniacus]
MRTRIQAQKLGAAVLAAAIAVPLALGSASAASAASAATGDGPVPRGPVPEESLVPGYPLEPKQPYQRITPDQGMFPPDGDAPDNAARGDDNAAPADNRAAPGDESRARPERRTPGAEYAVPSALIEYVPRGEQIQDRAAKPRMPRCSRSTGPYQRFVERYLKLKVDGRQSPSDCLAIQKYQTAVGIYPNSGFAGPVTWKVMTLRWAQKHPDRLRGCPTARGKVVCMDLNRQLLWVTNNGRMVYKPVPVRTGKPGYETRTGWNRITNRVRHEWSRLYESPMPFSQYFNGGQAIHGVYDDLYTTSGSHGCVNLEYQDAARLWKLLRQGDRVYSWGRKPNP